MGLFQKPKPKPCEALLEDFKKCVLNENTTEKCIDINERLKKCQKFWYSEQRLHNIYGPHFKTH